MVNTFEEAVKILNIEDYKLKIYNSNSKGELFHLALYIELANICEEHKEHKEFKDNFRKYFLAIVEHAEDTWDRPESIYQHIDKYFTN